MATPDLYEILANLDYLVQGPKTRSLQDKSFGSYKNEVLFQIAEAMGNQYTANEVEEQIWQAFRLREIYPENAFDLLFLHGSSEFKPDREEQGHIDEHLKTIRLTKALEETPRNDTLRLRSIVTIPTKRQKQHPSTAYARLLRSSHKSRNKSVGRSAISKPNTLPKHKRTMPKDKETQTGITAPSIKLDGTPCHSPVPEFSAVGLHRYVPRPGGDSAGRQESVLGNAKPLQQSIEPEERSVFKTRWSPVVSSETDYITMTSELAYYKERYKKAEHECLILKKQRQQIENLSGVPKETIKILKQNTRTISNLKKSLEDRTNLERYLSISNTQCAVSNAQRLLTQFQRLKNDLPTVLVMDGRYEPPVGELKGSSADLDDLLSTVFGRDGLYKLDEIPGAFPALTSYELIQALTGAAIYSWIFGSAYRTHVMGVTPLLQEYRHLIATLCDQESLFSLDVAVHQSIIEDKRFQDMIVPEMSKTFTSRLTNALQPLLERGSRRSAIKKLRGSLYSIMHLAVQIRTKALVSTDGYQLIWPPVGSLFDGKEMETENTGSIAVVGVVRLPLCPGIRAYNKEKAIVDYRGLGTGKTSDVSPKYVFKALVLR